MSRQLRNKYIGQMIEDRHSLCFRALFSLLQQMLKDARTVNDTATLEEVPKIQGEIRVINRLIKELTPKKKQTPGFDGGFGE